MELTHELVLERLKQVIDPEVGLNIVDLGLIYEVSIDNDAVTVRMTLTTPGCPMGSYITGNAESALQAIDGVTQARIELVWSPPWSPERIRPGALN